MAVSPYHWLLNVPLGLRTMRKIALAAFIVLSFAACSERAPPPSRSCFEATEESDQTPMIKEVLGDARRRSAWSCDEAGAQCQSSASSHPDGSIVVIVEFALLDTASGQCAFLPGGFEGHVYDAEGNFVRTIPGL